MFDTASGSSILQIMRHYGAQIDDGRSLADSLRYAAGELRELADEIERRERSAAPGPDGIVGEAVDVMVCLADIIVRAAPETSDHDLTRIFDKKCRKWLAKWLPDRPEVQAGTWLLGQTCRGPVEVLLVASGSGRHDQMAMRYPRTGFVQQLSIRDAAEARRSFEAQRYVPQAGRAPLALREPINRALRAAA